jgi:aspartate ammonia-lyase
MSLLTTGVGALDEKCVRGLAINVERNARNVDTVSPRLVRLTKRYGYSEITDICMEAGGDLGRLRRLLHARE